MTEWSQAEAEARASAAGFLWCPAFPFHAHTWRLAGVVVQASTTVRGF